MKVMILHLSPLTGRFLYIEEKNSQSKHCSLLAWLIVRAVVLKPALFVQRQLIMN